MDISKYIDHTLLKPDSTEAQIIQLCQEAIQYKFRSVCIPPYYIKTAVNQLEKYNNIKVSTVIGFPLGYSSTPSKIEEIKRAIDEGIDELDVMVNLSALSNNNLSYLRNDIDSMTRAAHLRGKQIKIIIEQTLLTPSQIELLCGICVTSEVDYVKTSTGFQSPAVTPKDVAYLRNLLPPNIKVKASGGIKTYAQAVEFIQLGADCFGTSFAVQIVNESQ